MTTFKCIDCSQIKPGATDVGTGYAMDEHGNKTCYSCCAKRDQAYMANFGKITLYYDGSKVSNWPGTLTFDVVCAKRGFHNIAGTRVDVWFYFGGSRWHGVQFGNDTQLLHCKQTKG